MGHKYQIDVTSIVGQINSAVYEQTSGYNEGFLSWGYKQDLYRIKWILEDALKRCPTYGPENEWLREQEKKQVVKILSNDIQ
jgi:predicted glycosyltransferase involved in capsule biosynthesis